MLGSGGGVGLGEGGDWLGVEDGGAQPLGFWAGLITGKQAWLEWEWIGKVNW